MSELMCHAWEWNSNNDDDAHDEDDDDDDDGGKTTTSAPMLAVAVVAQVLAQGGRHFAARIDELLCPTVSWTTIDASVRGGLTTRRASEGRFEIGGRDQFKYIRR